MNREPAPWGALRWLDTPLQEASVRLFSTGAVDHAVTAPAHQHRETPEN